ncbi:MAG: hypothetical protein AD742_01305 [Methylibium sp. NZG]|nr:MAG: hypothetical protein AD742_01305 [Methylibium sp. NZG]
MRAFVWLALLPCAWSLSQAQTRPIVNPEELARQLAERDAQLLSAARAWRIEPSVGALVTATSNSGFAFSDAERDVIVDIEPRLLVRGRGASFTLEGDVGLKRLIYTQSTQKNRLLPNGQIALNANVVDRWLYFDVSALAEQVAADPYTTRADGESSLNKINSLQYRFSPYLQHSFTPAVSLSLRSDNVWTDRRGEFVGTDPRRDSFVKRDSVLFEQRPQPLGFSVEAAQETTEYRAGIRATVLEQTQARGVVTYALDPTLIVGLVGGKERSIYTLSSTVDTIAGLRLNWAPTERTELRGVYEKRYFGNGGSLQWTHRSPFIAFNFTAAREPSALGTSFQLNPGAGDVATLLDAIFTTRYPNPSERAVIVGNVIAGLGVPSVLGSPVEVFSDYAQLRDSVTLSAVFQGVRSTLAARIYAVKSRQLTQADAPLVPIVGLQADNSQRGFAIDFTRRLTRTLTGEAGLGYGSIEGLAFASGQSTRNTSVRFGLTQALSPKTKATVGARYLRTDLSTIGSEGSAKELAAFAGMTHRY